MADDVQITQPLDPNDEDNEEKIAATEDQPDAPPDDVYNARIIDHQEGDTNVQPEEVIDVGEGNSIGVNDPSRSGPPHDSPPKYEGGDAEGYDSETQEEASAEKINEE